MRKHKFVTGEYYHVYNRGVDKRDIFNDVQDFERFIETINQFNSLDCFGGIYLEKIVKNRIAPEFGHPMSKLVTIIAFCILGNHFHFILKQEVDGGISKFMQKFGNGYTKYFNIKNTRTGSLFGGRFKSTYVDSNEYLMKLFAYVSSNYKIHDKFGHPMSKFVVASDQYIYCPEDSPIKHFDPEIVLEQFRTEKQLLSFIESVIRDVREKRGLSNDSE